MEYTNRRYTILMTVSILSLVATIITPNLIRLKPKTWTTNVKSIVNVSTSDEGWERNTSLEMNYTTDPLPIFCSHTLYVSIDFDFRKSVPRKTTISMTFILNDDIVENDSFANIYTRVKGGVGWNVILPKESIQNHNHIKIIFNIESESRDVLDHNDTTVLHFYDLKIIEQNKINTKG